MKVLGVVLDRRLTFAKHVMALARSGNYHTQAIHHIRHLLSTDLATALACSLIQSRLDYCNSLLHGAPTGSISTLQRVQNNAARIVLQAPRRSHARPLLCQCTGCQFITLLTTSWLWWLTRSTALQHCHISVDTSSCASLHVPYAHRTFHCLTPAIRTEFAKRSFRYSAPSVWDWLSTETVNSNSLTIFKSKLKSL